MFVYLKALLLAELLEKLNGIHYSNRFYRCGTNQINSIDHIVLDFPEFSDMRVELILLCLNRTLISLEGKFYWLLRDEDKQVNLHVVKFWAAIVKSHYYSKPWASQSSVTKIKSQY